MRRTQQQWLTLFQAQNSSDLSIKDFCLEQSIPTSSFYKYRAILNNSAKAFELSPFSQVQLIEPDAVSVVASNVITLNIGKVKMIFEGEVSSYWLASLAEELA